MNNIILTLCFFFINFLLSMDEEFSDQNKIDTHIQEDNYRQTKSFVADEKDRIVNLFCIKNNIISAHESGILNVWDESCRAKSKYFDLWNYLGSQKNYTNIIIPQDSPGRVIQNTLYHNKIIYFVGSRTIAPNNITPYNNVGKKSLQQLIIFNIDNKQYKQFDFFDHEISLIVPTGNILITKPLAYDTYNIYSISNLEKIYNLDPLKCASVNKDMNFISTHSYFKQYAFNNETNSFAVTIESALGFYKDIQLAIFSTNDWKVLRKNSINIGVIQSLAFNKNGSRLACLASKNIYEIDTQEGTLLRIIPLIKSSICQIDQGLSNDREKHTEKKCSHTDNKTKITVEEMYDFDIQKEVWTNNTIETWYPIAIAYSNNEIVASNGNPVEEKVAYTENGLTKIKIENNTIFLYRKNNEQPY